MKKSFSDFVPLILIFSVVLVATYISFQYIESNSAVDAMRLFMGYFFLIFGAFKVAKLRGFVDAYSTYDLLAMRSRVYGYLYPFIELGLAALFLSGMFLTIANIITLALMSSGALGVYLKLRQREEIPCACLGVVFKIPMTYVTLFEDLLMATMAALMLFVV
jgi:uncharacterized membrane protein YphA (DoxX/SURF4 family)